MNKLIYMLLIGLSLSACKKTETAALGTWQLEEELIDPGDGSGKFKAVDSDKTITFLRYGKLESNGSLCEISGESGQASTGTYNKKYLSITPNSCPSTNTGASLYHYDIVDGKLIFTFNCIEGCQQKFRKID